MLLSKFTSIFSDDIGIDLGTMNTLVHVAGRGIVLEEPSVVALNKDTGKVIAVGTQAKEMLGRNPGNILTVRPMKDGVIANAEVADEMLRYFINKSRGHYKVMQPRVIIAVPYGINEVETRAVQDSAKKAGAREVRLVEEPLASAIGVKLPVAEPTGSMIVDIGGGTSEVAIISLSNIVEAESVKCGGDAMDDAIKDHMMKVHSLLIGERTAEDIKKKIGSAYKVDNMQEEMEVSGRELGQHGNSLPRTMTITADYCGRSPHAGQMQARIGRRLDQQRHPSGRRRFAFAWLGPPHSGPDRSDDDRGGHAAARRRERSWRTAEDAERPLRPAAERVHRQRLQTVTVYLIKV